MESSDLFGGGNHLLFGMRIDAIRHRPLIMLGAGSVAIILAEIKRHRFFEDAVDGR